MPLELREFQLQHAPRLLAVVQAKRAVFDGSDPGTGKTYTAAWVAQQLGVETLVIAPLSVVAVWQNVLREAGVNATVTNYEKAHRHFGDVKPWGTGSFFQFSKPWPLVIFDECHRVAGDTTINSKMAIAAKRQCGRVMLLSATAVTTVMKMKATGFILGIHNLANYRSWLFDQGVREIEFKLKNGRRVKKLDISRERDAAAMSKLHADIFGAGNRGSRMRIADIPNFPQTTIEVRLLADTPAAVSRLSDELQAFYRQRNMAGVLSEDELAKIVFFRQASETAKIPHAIDMIEDALLTSRVAVFCNFNATADALLAEAKKRGWTTGSVRGGQNAQDRFNTVAAYQRNETDLLVANLAAGGVALSLHDEVTKLPRTLIIFPSWRAEDLKQAFGRGRRDGGGFSRCIVVYWDHGIERGVARAVERKTANLDLLNDGDVTGESDPLPGLVEAESII